MKAILLRNQLQRRGFFVCIVIASLFVTYVFVVCENIESNVDKNARDYFSKKPLSGLDSIYTVLREVYHQNRENPWLCIDLSKQTLYVVIGNRIHTSYPISSAKEGVGNKAGSDKTPLGIHRIAEKIGEGAPVGMVFRAKKSTGQMIEIIKDSVDIAQDVITTRILTLSGCEDGINRGNGIDSYQRCIYLHGTQEEGLIGTPVSHGCIRMKNNDIVVLYNQVEEGTIVNIINGF